MRRTLLCAVLACAACQQIPDRPAPSACSPGQITQEQIAALHRSVLRELQQKGQDVAAFERNSPKDCPMQQVLWDLETLDRLGI